MAVPLEGMDKLIEAATDGAIVAGAAFIAVAGIRVFKKLYGAVEPLERNGNLYDFDDSYKPKVAEYVYFEGNRYKLRADGDEEDDEMAEPDGYRSQEERDAASEREDQIWDEAVESSRKEFNGERL